MINKKVLIDLFILFSLPEVMRLRKKVEAIDKVEKKFNLEIERYTNELTESVFAGLMLTGEINQNQVNFADIFVRHSIDAMEEGIISAQNDLKFLNPKKKLAKKPPEVKMPKKLSDLMDMWDKYRQGRLKPSRQISLGERIKKIYLKKVQSAWKKISGSFLEGEIVPRDDIVAALNKEAKTTIARAQMIVQTETTYYYNKVRTEIYNESPDITHYLYMPIRDKSTTKWCETRRGLVYTKDTETFKKETPPVHWNCRSEILPLSPLNPRHLAIINDMSRRRENRKPEPLPPGWGKR